MSSVAQALVDARALGIDRLDAQWLLAWVLDRDSSWIICHDEEPLAPAELTRYQALVLRRAAGEPYAYLIGEREFHGLTLQVSPAVLVPRPDTEILVDWALELLAMGVPGSPQPEVIDLGTGSGAIALAVKHRHPAALVTALDTSSEALAVARGNAHRLGLSIELRQSDWWQAVANRRFGLALSNPPYIAAQDEHLSALAFEPMLALSPGGDGLGAIQSLLEGAPGHLLPGAWLLIEHGWDQATAVQDMMRQAGFGDVTTRHDLGGQARCTGGRRAPTA